MSDSLSERFLLSQTPTTSHRIQVNKDQGKSATFAMEVNFDLTFYDTATIVWFLQAAKANKDVRHSYEHHDDTYRLEYDPTNHPLEQFVITRIDTGRTIAMGVATALKLLNALTGKTERLVKESEKDNG